MDPGDGARRWAVLTVGMVVMVAACAFQYGMPFLVPSFRAAGLTLTQAGLLVSAPVVGILSSLVAWGVVTDRVGERRVLVLGLGVSALLLGVASVVDGPVHRGLLLVLAGAAGSCVHVASGRLILQWFPPGERGVAMGLRQTAQPLGVALAALTLPSLGTRGIGLAMAFLAACALLAAGLVVTVIRDRGTSATQDHAAHSPYQDGFLWRLHASSTLLVVPQFTVGAFGFDYLTGDRAWDAAAAGALMAAAQLGGGAMRLGAGWWSDRVRSRLRPMRTLAVTTAVVLGGLATAALVDQPAAAVVLLAGAAVLTASTNGLAFTAVAERAGGGWAGRALGVQNTTQNLAAAATPPAVAAVVSSGGTGTGYATAFCAVVAFPLMASLVLPLRQERSP